MRELRVQPFGPIQMIEVTLGAQRRNILVIGRICRVIGIRLGLFSGTEPGPLRARAALAVVQDDAPKSFSRSLIEYCW
jgi:hypothetical protein